MFISNIFNSLVNFFSKKNTYLSVKLSIPTDIVIHTKLICNYISNKENYILDLQTLIYILYSDFIRAYIEDYTPEEVYKLLTTNYIDNNTLIITNGYDETIIKNKISYYTCILEFESEEAQIGQLILDEIKELFHISISFNSLISQLWIGYIHKYRIGENKKAFSDLIKILKKNFD